MLTIKDEYFSASTNRSLGVLDIYGDLLAFGSSNAILLYNYQVSPMSISMFSWKFP